MRVHGRFTKMSRLGGFRVLLRTDVTTNVRKVMPATSEIARELGHSDVALWTSWMSAVANLPGDPYGVSVLEVGSATLLHVHGIPVPYYNRVMGLPEEEAELLVEALSFFGERRSPCRVDLNPFVSGPALLGHLNGWGFHPSEFQTNLYGRIGRLPKISAPGVSVRRVDREELDFFADLYERAYHGDSTQRRLARFRKDSIKARSSHPGWYFYLVSVDGLPAGGGSLFIDDRIATLAGGATIFTLRGRGCHHVLLHRRLLDARAAGCEIVVSRCAVGSLSQRNMERAGLQTAYTKSIWEPSILL